MKPLGSGTGGQFVAGGRRMLFAETGFELVSVHLSNGTLKFASFASLMLCGSVLNASSLRIGIGLLDNADGSSVRC